MTVCRASARPLLLLLASVIEFIGVSNGLQNDCLPKFVLVVKGTPSTCYNQIDFIPKNELSSVLDKFDCMHPWNSFLTLVGIVDRLMEDQVSDGIL